MPLTTAPGPRPTSGTLKYQNPNWRCEPPLQLIILVTICTYSTAPTWWCLLLLIYRWYLPMLLCDICPATWWYLRALLDFQVCGMLPPIRVPSVEACGTAVWSNFGFWFEPRSEPATFKIRPTHTIVPSLILMFNVQYSLFNVQCSMFCGRSIFNFKDQANAHNRSITHTYQCSMFKILYFIYNVQCSVFSVRRSMFNFEDQTNTQNRSITHTIPYLIIVIFSPRTNSPEKYAITQSFHHSLIKIRFTQH